jgi:hypothetical protein
VGRLQTANHFRDNNAPKRQLFYWSGGGRWVPLCAVNHGMARLSSSARSARSARPPSDHSNRSEGLPPPHTFASTSPNQARMFQKNTQKYPLKKKILKEKEKEKLKKKRKIFQIALEKMKPQKNPEKLQKP